MISALLKVAFKRFWIYPKDAMFSFIAIFLWSMIGYITLYTVFSKFDTVGTWTKDEAFLLYATWLTSFAVYNIFGSSFINFDQYVISGKLDNLLLKECPAFLQIFLSKINVMGLSFLLLGIFVQSKVLLFGKLNLSFIALVYLIVSQIIGGAILFEIIFILSIMSFWIQKTESIVRTSYDIHKFVQFPLEVYPSALRMILLIIPFGITNWLPCSIVLNKVSYAFWLLNALVLFLLFVLAKLLWGFGLKRYEGSNS